MHCFLIPFFITMVSPNDVVSSDIMDCSTYKNSTASKELNHYNLVECWKRSPYSNILPFIYESSFIIDFNITEIEPLRADPPDNLIFSIDYSISWNNKYLQWKKEEFGGLDTFL